MSRSRLSASHPHYQSYIKLTHVVQLPTASIHRLEQLIHLIITHLLPQIRQNVSELSHANEAREVLVKDLEATTILLWLAGVAETAGSVENAGEGVEVDCFARQSRFPNSVSLPTTARPPSARGVLFGYTATHSLRPSDAPSP